MAPYKFSRVSLLTPIDGAGWRDPVFNQPLTRIDWDLSSPDKQTYLNTTQLYKTAVEKRGGKVSILQPWEVVKKELVVNGHHIGTTRMSSDPKMGVVDQNLKVHSLENH